MFSLDRSLLDSRSRAAFRMRLYGETDELFIVVPDSTRRSLDLGPRVHVTTTGGRTKLCQLYGLVAVGAKLAAEMDVSIVTAQDPFFTGWAGMRVRRRLRPRRALTLEVQVHGDFFGSRYYLASGLMNAVRYATARYCVLPRADRIRVAGQRVRQSLLRLGIPDERLAVRPVPLDQEKLRTTVARNLRQEYPDDEKIFVYVGRLEPVKRVGWLIDIFSELIRTHKKRYRLIVVGDGSCRRQLERRAARKKCADAVIFLGQAADPFPYIKGATAVVFPSLSEGYGLVPLEARALCTPVIMTDVGVANYELEPGPEVRIVPVGDRAGFKQAMLRI